jgi:hypothetical protein
MMYWATDNDIVGGIWRANLDGSGQTPLIQGHQGGARGIALDLAGGQIYWTDGSNQILRANLDGTSQTTLVNDQGHPVFIALDLLGGKMYWGDVNSNEIQRANLDGSGQEILVRNLMLPGGIALDVANGQMYWIDNQGVQQHGQDIRRANLDGSGQTILLNRLSLPRGIALDLRVPLLSRFQITAAPTAVAGTPFDVTVTALDSSGNLDSSYQGTVSFSSTDPYPGVLPATYTFTTSDQGSHTFSGGVTLFTAGTQTLAAQDTATSALTGSATVTVVAASASQFLVTGPAAAVSGTAFDVRLVALDPYGNVDMNYAGTMTWTSSDTDPGVVLPPNYTFQPTDNGMVTFSGGVTLITLGNQTLTAADTVSGISGSASVTVGP